MTDNKDSSNYEEVCSVCRRTESVAGEMIHLQEGICICRDCMQKSFDMINEMSANGQLDDLARLMQNMPSPQAGTGRAASSGHSEKEASKEGDEDKQSKDNKEERSNSGTPLFLNLGSIFGGQNPNLERTRIKKKEHKEGDPPLIDIGKVPAPHKIKAMLDEYLAELDHLTDKIERLDSRIEELASGERYRENVSKLVCLLGIKTYTAMSLLVETGDFKRFKKAELYASFLGLTPSENSSSDKINRGGITKAGNSHLRRLLTESAQGYSKGRPGYKSKALKARQAGNKAATIQYADKANDRLRRKFQRMTAAGKPHNVAKSAIARELACFIWGIMTDNVA